MENKKISIFKSLDPLEIPCILQQILHYLPHSDLKKSRLVCSTFDEEASRIFKKKSKIVLNSTKRLIAFYLEKFSNVNRFCECIQLINVYLGTPSMKLVIQNIGSDIKSLDLRDSKWSCTELEDILTSTVNSLTELTIHGQLPKNPTRILQIANEKLPLVKQLDLQLFDKGPDEEFMNQFVTDILTATYNLEVLRSRDTGKWRNRREKFHRILFEILINPESGLKFLKLRRMDFSLSPWSDEQIKRLASNKFPLAYLNLAILPTISVGALTTLLISLRHTLMKLKLTFTYWRVTELPCHMKLDKLQHLSLDWFNGSMAFVTHLQSLQTLILAQVDLNSIFTEEEVQNFLKPHRLISRLEVYQHSGAVVLPKTVELMADVFPLLKKLVLGKLNDESLRVVWTKFPLVEEFSAIEGEFTDSGVTGIELESCGVCDQKHLFEIGRGNRGLYNESLVNQQRQHAFIGNWKNLRKLELRSPSLTNLSVLHGVAFCEQLRSLSMWCYELTFRSLKKLMDTLKLDILETQKVSFTHRSELRYVMTKMQGKTLILNGLVAPKNLTSMYSDEAMRYIGQFSENMSRALLNDVVRPDHPHHRLLLIYEACMAEQHALYGLLNL